MTGTKNVPNSPSPPNIEELELLDTTLREGEQTPGVALSLDDKIDLAQRLDAFGVDWIEVGHPAVSDNVRRSAKALCDQDLEAPTLAHARAIPEDIDEAAAVGADAVGIFFSVSDPALEQRFRRDLDSGIELVVEAVERARDHGLTVRYTPEDTVRTPPETVHRVAQAVCEAGADRISVADTTGWMTPRRMQRFVADLDEAVPAPIHAHCHDDLGLAVANALAAVRGGAHTIDVSLNGLGERAGITDLATFAVAADRTLDVDHDWQLDQLPDLAEHAAQATGVPVPELAPVVGDNAFAHNAGLHVAAVLQDPGHYESIPAGLVGRQRRLVLGPMSGQATVSHRLRQAGIEPTDVLVDRLVAVLEDRGESDLTDEQLARLARDIQIARAPEDEALQAEVQR